MTFDEVTRVLSVGGAPVHIETQPLALFLRLMAGRGDIVEKQDLIVAGWGPKAQVSDQSVMTAIFKVRRCLRDRELVVAERGRGYRLKGAVICEPSPTRRADLEFSAGNGVPGRPGWRLVSPFAASRANDVWLAAHDSTRERRVVKFAEKPERVKALRNEVRISEILRESLPDDDDFLPILEADLLATPARIESEYYGPDLVSWAAKRGGLGSIALEIRLRIVADVAQAVGRAHAVGVLHGDLQPRNIVINETATDAPRPRLIDFGAGGLTEAAQSAVVSRSLQYEPTDSGLRQIATLAYAAPELATIGRPSVQTDIFALGILLFHVAAGEFGQPMTPDWQRHVDNQLLVEDIAAASAHGPEHRLTSAAELAERLRNLQSRSRAREARAMEQAETTKLREADERRRRRRPWLAALAATGLLAALSSVWAGLSAVRERDAVLGQRLHTQQVASVLELTVGTLTGGLANGLRDHRGLSVAAVGDMLGKAQGALATMTRLVPDAALRQLQATALTQFAETLLRRGSLKDAESVAKNAVSLQEDLLAKDPPNLMLMAGLRESERCLGDIAIERRDMAAALIAYKKAVVWAEKVARAQPNGSTAERILGETEAQLVYAEEEIGDSETALANGTAAIDALQRGLRIHPNDPEWLTALALAEERVGEVLDSQHKAVEALEAFTRCVTMRELALLRDPANTRYQRNLEIALRGVGNELAYTGDHLGATASYKRSLAIAQSLAASDPTDLTLKRDVIANRTALSDEQAILGELSEAIASYVTCLGEIEELKTNSPGDVQLEDDLIIVENNIAIYYGKLNKPSEAHFHHARASELFSQIPSARRQDTEVIAMERELRNTAGEIGLSCDEELRCRQDKTQ